MILSFRCSGSEQNLVPQYSFYFIPCNNRSFEELADRVSFIYLCSKHIDSKINSKVFT